MALILNIDTATEQASVSLALDGKIITERSNNLQKDHATWIHTAIENLFPGSSYTINDLSAIAVVAGPGSYTGLRVAMSTAKGLCYVLKVPLISLNTLSVMAFSFSNVLITDEVLICPMIDARRMEVYTALFDTSMTQLMQPCAMMLEQGSFDPWLQAKQVVFFGSGAFKWQKIANSSHALFHEYHYQPAMIAKMSFQHYTSQDFSNLAYAVPIYVKDFHSHQK